MNEYEIMSVKPTDLGQYWVITFKTNDGKTEQEVIEALDSHEACIKFRNQMINQAKAKITHNL